MLLIIPTAAIILSCRHRRPDGDLPDFLILGDDLAGERGTVEVVESYFVLSTPLETLIGGRNLRDQIGQHMDRNPGDWSVEFLFGEIGAFDCSRARFAALLEEAVHPPWVLSRTSNGHPEPQDQLRPNIFVDPLSSI